MTRVQLTLEISSVTKNATIYYCQFGPLRPNQNCPPRRDFCDTWISYVSWTLVKIPRF